MPALSGTLVPAACRRSIDLVMAPSLPSLIPLLFLFSAQSTNANTGTSVWVSVDASGQPTTVTPVVTTLDGSRTVVNGAPAEAADEVVTQTSDGTVVTSTRAAPLATASNAAGAGSFAPCENPDGEFAPFCSVGGGGPLLVGNTYYSGPSSFYFFPSRSCPSLQARLLTVRAKSKMGRCLLRLERYGRSHG